MESLEKPVMWRRSGGDLLDKSPTVGDDESLPTTRPGRPREHSATVGGSDL